MAILTDFCKLPYKELEESDRQAVREFLIKKANITVKELNFRTVIKIYELLRHSKTHGGEWQMLAHLLFQEDEELRIVQDCLSKADTVSDAITLFVHTTGKSRATFFRKKRELEVLQATNDNLFR
jgi:hypothetical protein